MLFKTRSVTEGFTEYSESSQNLAVMSTIEKLRTPSFRLFPYSFARRARPASASPAPGLAAYRAERLLALVKRRSQDVDRTNEAVTRQIVTMGGDVFEIGLYKPEGAGNSTDLPVLTNDSIRF